MPRNHCEQMTKNGATRFFCWSVDKRQALSEGWVLEGTPAAPEPEPAKLPEIAVEVGVDAYDSVSIENNVVTEVEFLSEMTKNELLDWALDQGYDLKNTLPKAEVLQACKEIEAKNQ